MKRISIVGSGGAGKSTVAHQLADILHLPVIHLDSLYWQPGWVETPEDQWHERLQQLVQQEQWIIDGNYTSTLDMRFAVADTIIFLDFPRLLCLYRAVKRRTQYAGKTRPDMAPGCPERIDRNFLLWIWNYPKNGRVRVLKKIEQYRENRHVIILRSPHEVQQFLSTLQTGKNLTA